MIVYLNSKKISFEFWNSAAKTYLRIHRGMHRKNRNREIFIFPNFPKPLNSLKNEKKKKKNPPNPPPQTRGPGGR
ncbi:hypothetical protein ABFV50_32490, partial [Bacillus cereus]